MPQRPREILSSNLRALMRARPALGTIRKIVEASQGRLSNGKVGRIVASTHTTDVDALEALADVFGVEPWQLLVENLNPAALPALSNASLLLQIREIVQKAEAASVKENSPSVDAPALVQRVRAQQLPSLKRALDVKGIGKNDKKHASGAARAAPKQKRGGGPS